MSRAPGRSPNRAARRGGAAGHLLVFLGPSLPAAEAQRLAPHAELRPPIAVGELLAIARGRRRPGCVAIVDGYFERMAAVWHKEILVALERGIAVWGAASMGALRAAELAPWGMVGVGRIYEAFASGALEADDEVAVAHLPAEHGHRPISDALVNLRDGLARWLERERPDRKGDDTRLLLRRLAAEGWQRPPPISVPRTWALRQLEHLIR